MSHVRHRRRSDITHVERNQAGAAEGYSWRGRSKGFGDEVRKALHRAACGETRAWNWTGNMPLPALLCGPLSRWYGHRWARADYSKAPVCCSRAPYHARAGIWQLRQAPKYRIGSSGTAFLTCIQALQGESRLATAGGPSPWLSSL